MHGDHVMADVLAVLCTVAGVSMGLAPVLQVRRMYLTRSSRDVSLMYFSVLIPGFVLWMSYGVVIANPALVISNTVSLSVALVTLLVAYRLRVSAGAPAAVPSESSERTPRAPRDTD